MSSQHLTSRVLDRAEFTLLVLFSIALPLVEAPKNIFWALFLILWIVNSFRQRNFGQLGRAWDCLFAALFLAPLLSVVFTPFTPQWKEIGDIAGYVSLGWMLARSRPTERQVRWLLFWIVAATFVGVLQGAWVMAYDPKRVWLQLNSVGHVNHSALYGAGAGIIAATWVVALWRGSSRSMRAASIVMAMLMFGSMIAFASRGAMACYLFGVLAVVMFAARVRLRSLALVGAAAVVLAVGAQWVTDQLMGARNNQTMIQKTLDGIHSGNLSSYRLETLDTALEMLRQYPLIGVGAANFSAVSPELLQQWVERRGETFVRENYYFSSHAHGVFTNTLAERGLIGFGVLCAFGLAWAVALWRRRPGIDTDVMARLCWGAGVAGWSVVFVGGLFNTTLHHEHGMLATLCLGLLLSSVPLRRKAAA